MMHRFITFEDCFEVTVRCRKCGNTDIEVDTSECGECGTNQEAECSKCGNRFRYHDFKQEEGDWIDDKWVKK